MRYKVKIGFVTNDKLYGGNSNHGHYVIVKGYDEKTRKMIVQKITSLEDYPYSFEKNKLKKIRSGLIVPIAIIDSSFKK